MKYVPLHDQIRTIMPRTVHTEERDAIGLIVAELDRVGEPITDYELVRRLGEQVAWGKGSIEIWRSIASRARNNYRITTVGPFKSRTREMKKPGLRPEERFPGNLIALTKWQE